MLRKLKRDEAGSTAIEYGLIASLVGTLLIGSITGLGLEVRCTLYSVTSRAFGASVPECGATTASASEGTGGYVVEAYDPDSGQTFVVDAGTF